MKYDKPTAEVSDFPPRSIAQLMAESAARVRELEEVCELERRALLAIIEDDPEVAKLLDSIARRNALGLRLR